MEYQKNILGEFKNKELEALFLAEEVRKGKTPMRYVMLFSGISFFLIGFVEFYSRKDVGVVILTYSLIARSLPFLFSVFLFVAIRKSNNVSFIRASIYTFASAIYVVYIMTSFSFAPVQVINPVFALILLSTSLFLLPNRWIVNVCVSIAYMLLFVLAEPYICTTTPFVSKMIALSYLCWNDIIISILFYNINVYKRNDFAKTLQLEELANTDQLTKIRNRKSCDDILENNCAESKSFAVILFDIDDFKSINDTYGHVVGDDVIVQITDFARTAIRKNDILARWGGEEFIIIMNDATLIEAEELAKRLKEQLACFSHIGINQSITCSFGVTTFIEGDNDKSLVKRADQLLYLAKEYGKNRVVAG